MKNLLIVLALVSVFAFGANAQSSDCCKKEKDETVKLEKCTQTDHTMKMGDKVGTTTTSTTALTDGKKTVEKEVVITKADMKEKCDENSSCCNMKKEKKVEKEVEKK